MVPVWSLRMPAGTLSFLAYLFFKNKRRQRKVEDLKFLGYSLWRGDKIPLIFLWRFVIFFLHLRCPETLFISHENANFLFSVFRVVQSEAKTPKIMGCCRANFAFLHALKIGAFRGKLTLEWVIKTSHFVLLALYFLINSKLAFFFNCFSTMPSENCKKCLS